MRSPETSATAGGALAHLLERRGVGVEVELGDEAEAADEPERILGEAPCGVTVRRTPARRSARPPNGSTSSPSAMSPRDRVDVKSRRPRSSSTLAVGIDDDLEVVPAGPRRALPPRRRELDPGRRERARPPGRADRGASRPARRRRRAPRPCRGGASAARRPAASSAGHEEVGVLRLAPEQLVADGAADEVRVESERARRSPRSPSPALFQHGDPPGPLRRVRSPRSRRARPTGSSADLDRRARRRRRRRRGAHRPRSCRRSRRGRCRNTVVFTSRSSDEPAASRIARRFAKRLLGLRRRSRPATTLGRPGLEPELAGDEDEAVRRDRLEYGAPWNGAGAASVRTAFLLIGCLLRLCGTPGRSRRRAP